MLKWKKLGVWNLWVVLPCNFSVNLKLFTSINQALAVFSSQLLGCQPVGCFTETALPPLAPPAVAHTTLTLWILGTVLASGRGWCCIL